MIFCKADSWSKLRSIFETAYEENFPLKGYIVFTEDNFDKPWPKESRTYIFDQNNKFFNKTAIGSSLFASSLDGSDECIRLNYYLPEWKIEECGLYFEED